MPIHPKVFKIFPDSNSIINFLTDSQFNLSLDEKTYLNFQIGVSFSDIAIKLEGLKKEKLNELALLDPNLRLNLWKDPQQLSTYTLLDLQKNKETEDQKKHKDKWINKLEKIDALKGFELDTFFSSMPIPENSISKFLNFLDELEKICTEENFKDIISRFFTDIYPKFGQKFLEKINFFAENLEISKQLIENFFYVELAEKVEDCWTEPQKIPEIIEEAKANSTDDNEDEQVNLQFNMS